MPHLTAEAGVLVRHLRDEGQPADRVVQTVFGVVHLQILGFLDFVSFSCPGEHDLWRTEALRPTFNHSCSFQNYLR